MHLVDGIERGARKQRVVQLKCQFCGVRHVFARLEVLDHLQRLGNIGDLLLEALATLRCANLHEFVLGDGLLKLLQRWHHILISTANEFGHVRDERGRGDAPLLRRGVHGHRPAVWPRHAPWPCHVDFSCHVLNAVLQRKSRRRATHFATASYRCCHVDAGPPVASCAQVEQLPCEAEGPWPRFLARAR